MAKAKYQLDDFLELVNDEGKGFVNAVHNMLVQSNYKPKIQIMKTTGLQLSYAEPKVKSVIGIIIIFFVCEGKLIIRIYGKNCNKYPQVLNSLPEKIVNQIDKADDCKKFIDPQKCWTGCEGYDFYIGEQRYQKCYTNCFQLDVDFESMPYLMELIKRECNERVA